VLPADALCRQIIISPLYFIISPPPRMFCRAMMARCSPRHFPDRVRAAIAAIISAREDASSPRWRHSRHADISAARRPDRHCRTPDAAPHSLISIACAGATCLIFR
jgi:hypothetical protein